jgi:hypothetical protein
MCDYSLMTFPNRLANESEILVTHKFSTGSIGFVSLNELCSARQVAQCAPAGLWGKLRPFFAVPAERPTISAVCIPPGARVKVRSIPERTRRTQFRDALRTKSGQEILLQAVGVGLQVQVMSLALAEEVRPHEEFSYNLVPRR